MIVIIPAEQTIVIDSEQAHTDSEHGSSIGEMFTSDIHSVTYNETTGMGHIEYVRDPYDTNPRPNEPIDSSSYNWDDIRNLHFAIKQVAFEEFKDAEKSYQEETDELWQKEQDEKYEEGYLVPHSPGPEDDEEAWDT
jgi:hypothetical protein